MAPFGNLLLTRSRGRDVAAKVPVRARLVLDFQGVDVASSSFLDEFVRSVARKGVRHIVFVNTTDRVRETLAILKGLEDGPAPREGLEVG